MAELVYAPCALASLCCAVLLVRQHRRKPTRLLLWSSLCLGPRREQRAAAFAVLVKNQATSEEPT